MCTHTCTCTHAHAAGTHAQARRAKRLALVQQLAQEQGPAQATLEALKKVRHRRMLQVPAKTTVVAFVPWQLRRASQTHLSDATPNIHALPAYRRVHGRIQRKRCAPRSILLLLALVQQALAPAQGSMCSAAPSRTQTTAMDEGVCALVFV